MRALSFLHDFRYSIDIGFSRTHMSDFIKTAYPYIPGIQKAAILLGELGSDASEAVFRHLHLSDQERRSLTSAIRRLGQYNPRDERQVVRELSVLQEAIDYGAAKGIFVASRKPAGQGNSVRSSADIARMAKTDPDAVARVLKSWLEK